MRSLINVKKIILNSFVLLTLAIFLWPTTAHAVTIQGTADKGTWSVTPKQMESKAKAGFQTVTTSTYTEIAWGSIYQKIIDKSSFTYTPTPVIFPITLGNTFDLGAFTTHNGVIPPNTAITGATLSINANFKIDGITEDIPLTFKLSHDETSNSSNPDICCRDTTTFLNNTPQSKVVTINGHQYTIDITGFFSQPIGGTLVNTLTVKEQKKGYAYLQGIITQNNVTVPEPSTYLILGSMMVIALYVLRQRRKALKNNI